MTTSNEHDNNKKIVIQKNGPYVVHGDVPLVRKAQVVRPDARGKAVVRVVRERDHLVNAFRTRDGDDWAKYLFLPYKDRRKFRDRILEYDQPGSGRAPPECHENSASCRPNRG